MNQEGTKEAQKEPTINDLKAAVYDRMTEIEQHSIRIQQLQQEVQQINAQIQKSKAIVKIQ